MHELSPVQAVANLTKYSNEKGVQMLTAWRNLATKLIVKYNDGLCKTEKDGKFLKKKGNFKTEFTRPGYGEKVKKYLVDQSGNRYAIPSWDKSDH